MAREMDSVQAERAGRSHIAPITLIKITTYSDRTAGIVEKELYLSDKAVEYDYGNTGTNQWFLPIVAGGSPFFAGFVHIPLPEDMSAFGESFDLVCSNLTINGRRPIAILRDYNIEGARVEISQLLLNSIDSLPIDLTAYDGDEHTVLFRGRVLRLSPVTDTAVTIQCAPDLPLPPSLWHYASGTSNTAKIDIGKRLPRVYGIAKHVPCVNYDEGWNTTLAEDIDNSETGTGYEIGDASGIPEDVAFTLIVDDEHISCLYDTTTTVELVTRGVDGTTPAAHVSGTLISALLETTRIVFNDRPSVSLDELYVIDPATGILHRMGTFIGYTVNLSNSNVIFGQQISTIEFTKTQWSALKSNLKTQTTPRFYADVSGVISPLADVTAWGLGESFDSGSWEVSGCTIAADTDRVEGAASQKLSVDVDALAGSEVVDTEAITDWNVNPTYATLAAVDDEGGRGGAYVIKAASIDEGFGSGLWWDGTGGAGLDLTDTGSGKGLVVMDVKFKNLAHARTQPPRFFGGWSITLATDDWLNEYIHQLSGDVFEDETWHTIIIDYENYTLLDGSPDPSDINMISLTVPNGIDAAICVDNIKIIRDVDRVAQYNHDLGTDYTGAGVSRYKMSGKRGVGVLSAGVELIISDDAGSGTVKPTDFREIVFPPTWPVGTWVEREADSYADTNTPDVSNINTMRIELSAILSGPPGIGIGLHYRDPIATFYFDALMFADTIGFAYYAAADTALVHPVDIMRHWIKNVGGEEYDNDAYAALYTSLGVGAQWAFDARTLGLTWAEVLQRMAYEARSNVVAIETASGREWNMLAAGSDYGFGIPPDSARITQTHEIEDIGRSADEVATIFSFNYAADAALSGSGAPPQEGFARVLNVSPEHSDTDISTALVAAAAAEIGYKDLGPVEFRCTNHPATAREVAGYIVQERIANKRRVFELRNVAWFDALPYNLGDPVRIAPPWLEIGNEFQLLDCDDHASDFTSAHTIANAASPKYEGSYSMKHTMNIGTQNSIAGTTAGAIGTQNLVDRSIVLRFYIPAAELAILKNVRMRISSYLGGSQDWAEWAYYPGALVADTWMRLEFPIRLRHAWATGGSVDLRNIINMWLRLQTISDAPANTDVYWDDIRVEHQSVPCRIASMAKAFESNTWTLTAVEIPEYGLRSV